VAGKSSIPPAVDKEKTTDVWKKERKKIERGRELIIRK